MTKGSKVMVKNLPIKFFGVIIIAVFAFGWAPALAQERADVKEEGGVKVERLVSGEIIFPDVVIEGRLERPVALFIKRQQPEFRGPRFARDFWDDILRPIDKEELAKYTSPKPFDYVKNPLLWMAVGTAGTSAAAAGYQAYNGEWPQVRVYGITAGAAAVAAATLVIIDRGLARGAR
jgi:hypothetical protein